ncbi:hypothetical protein [Clostridium sp.]|uniref:hypothetical protein n=1 Tax=Clostridium sp. TaxID=1506 RepID=UPI003216C4E1
MYKDLMKEYLNRYYPDLKGDERKAQENRVKPLIRKLTDKLSIYKDLPFDSLAIAEQINLLYYILEKSSERQLVANMGKTDVDRDYYNFILQDEDKDWFTKEFLESIEGFETYNIVECKWKNRNLIRYTNVPSIEVLKELTRINESIIRLLVEEISLFKMKGIGFEHMPYITDYIDYVSDGLLQFLNYRVIWDKDVDSLRVMSSLLNALNTLYGKIDFQLERRKEHGFHKLDAEKLSRYFSFYRTADAYYQEVLGIYDTLKKEVDENPTLFSPVEDKYKVRKEFISEEEVGNLQETITEGLHSYDYNTKLGITRRFIELMGSYGGRQCFPNCPQDLKTYYREIFMSEVKYRNKQAATIVKEYLDKIESSGEIVPFDKKSQYMFVREKISRGYFREKGLLDVYFLKVDIERALYNLLMKLYLFYDFWDILEFIYTVNHSILDNILRDMRGQEKFQN